MLNKNVLKDLCREGNDFSRLAFEGINSHLNTNLYEPHGMLRLDIFYSFQTIQIFKRNPASCSIATKMQKLFVCQWDSSYSWFYTAGAWYSQSLKTGSIKGCECVNQQRKEEVWGGEEKWEVAEGGRSHAGRAFSVSLYQLSCSPTSYFQTRILTNSIYFYPSFGTGRWKSFTDGKLSCL